MTWQITELETQFAFLETRDLNASSIYCNCPGVEWYWVGLEVPWSVINEQSTNT